ncbi:His Kinase A (phospho-acceptor) domain-containing protein [Neorhodopirellula lusitana]|uniref:histidine kinase n=1 Tax=Neorhodopirellula lusitana TaxID=445327 RepID=A0ABY1PRY5_9BACT|nr:His Kinase A (phospho-acceptor) domain-containing protein [Neorhodopirellula lusitana]
MPDLKSVQSPRPAKHSMEEATAEIAALKSQVRHMQGLVSLGELTGTATHEFNNVLMTVINYAKLGLRNEDKASRDKALNKILDASERAAKITNTILAQARNRSDAKEPTDLVALVNDTLVLLGREMQKYRISVETDLAENTPMISASGNQLQRLLLNLMTNARQAMGEGGTLLIRVGAQPAVGGQPETVELTIRDSGAGIPQDVLPKIFDPFFSTKSGPDESGKGGTGLGLAACKDIIDEHDGKIRVESSVGRGTAFIIRLPVQASQKAAA